MFRWTLMFGALTGLMACASRSPSPEASAAPPASPKAPQVEAPGYSISAEQTELEGEAVARIRLLLSESASQPLLGLKLVEPLSASTADGASVPVTLDQSLMGFGPDGFLVPDRFEGQTYLELTAPNAGGSRVLGTLEGELSVRVATGPQVTRVPLDAGALHTHTSGMLPPRSGSFTGDDGQEIVYRWVLWSDSPCPEGHRLDRGMCTPLEDGAEPDGTRQYTFEVVPSRENAVAVAGLSLVDADGQSADDRTGPGTSGNSINVYGDPGADPFAGYSIDVRYFTGSQDLTVPIQETDLPILFHDGKDQLPSPVPVEPRAGEQLHVVYVAVFSPEEADAAWNEHMPLAQSNQWPVTYGEIGCTWPDEGAAVSGFDSSNGDQMTVAFLFDSADDATRFADTHFASVAGITTSTPSCLD